MPIYEYSCKECDHKFSHLHKRLGEAAPNCPKCGSANVKKLFSTFSAATASASSSCAAADACPHVQEGHHCCPGCCHHHG
ncbi:MAG: zinc ribbon domain-containing protein [Victivallales bacterium]|jgi:putative FmdB family regulatory protein|nr:zinc ribbon domain-containing protein [Victivallales bacterium]MBR5838777.1 zinc ribbon domain-containing protein [Victivallales bacterium]